MRAAIVVLGLSLASPAMGTLNAQEIELKEFELLESTWTEFGGSLDFIMGLLGANDGQTQRLMVSGGLSTVRAHVRTAFAGVAGGGRAECATECNDGGSLPSILL